jgi:Ca2+/Na+ antiporter
MSDNDHKPHHHHKGCGHDHADEGGFQCTAVENDGHGNDTHDHNDHGCGHAHHDDEPHAHDEECGHDHDHSACGHSNDGEEDEKSPADYNTGLLKRALGGTGASDTADQALNNTRSLALLAGASALALWDTSNSVAAMSVVGGASLLIANEAANELMESVQYVKKKLALGGATIGMVLSAAHVGAEGVIGIYGQINDKFNQAADYAMQLTMANNYTHAALMMSTVALAGALKLDKPEHRKMNLAAMIVTSSALAVTQVAGEYSAAAGAVGITTGLGYAWWRIRAGIGCTEHGDLCGHTHEGPKDETDYISWNYLGGLAKRVKAIEPEKAFQNLTQSVRNIGNKLTNYTPPTPRQVWDTTLKLAPLGLSFGALEIAAHGMADNAVLIAEQSGVNTATLSMISAIGNVAPELIAGLIAVRMRENALAAAMIVGCTVLGTGVVGGAQNILGWGMENDLPSSLDLATFNGKAVLTGLFAPIAAYAAMTSEPASKFMGKIENKVAERFFGRSAERAAEVSAREPSVSKTTAAFILSASLGYAALSTLPICHSHGQAVHCFDAPIDDNILQLPGISPEQN